MSKKFTISQARCKTARHLFYKSINFIVSMKIAFAAYDAPHAVLQRFRETKMRNLVRDLGLGSVLLFGIMVNAGAAQISGLGDPLTNGALIGGTQQGFDTVASGQYATITLGDVTYSGVGAPLTIGTDFNGSFNTSGGKSMYNDFDLVPDQFNFDFATPVSAFAFNWGAADNKWLLSVFDSSNVFLESFLIPGTFGSNAGEYFGISRPGISHATLVDQRDNIPDGDYVFIDRFTTSAAVPEPASLALLGIGLAGLGFSRRKQ